MPSQLPVSAPVRHIVEVLEQPLVRLGDDTRLLGWGEDGVLRGELLVEIAHVFARSNGGHEGRTDLPEQQVVPMHGPEELLLFHVQRVPL